MASRFGHRRHRERRSTGGEQDTLRAVMRAHLDHVREAARDNEFVDAAEAIRLHMLLTHALGGGRSSTPSSAPSSPTP